VIEISVAEEGRPPPARYAVDDKAGPEAFKIDQARAYAKMLKQTGNEYDGFIYICSDPTDAQLVARAIENDPVIQKTGMAAKLVVTHFDPNTGGWVKL
jgi:hypothetical protein